MIEFVEFPKIPRLFRDCVITEKIDGTNASIYIPEIAGEAGELPFLVGSRTRWITPENDNYGFARWAYENTEELLKLGPGHHFGEWWGAGIQRRYDQKEKHFSLFNVERWEGKLPTDLVSLVPLLYRGPFFTDKVEKVKRFLEEEGSMAAPGFKDPEGVVIWHKASRQLFKSTLKDDGKHKGEV